MVNSLCRPQFRYNCLLIYVLACLSWSSHVKADLNTAIVGHWPLDADQGLLAEDISARGGHGIIYGSSIVWQPDAGRVGGAISMDGRQGQVADYVEIPMDGMQPTEGSVVFWAKLNDNPQSPGTRYCFGHTTLPPCKNRIQLYLDNGDRRLDLGLGDSHARRTGIHILEVGQWYHIALTWNRGTYRVYMDGELKATGDYSGLSTFQGMAHLGNNGNSTPNQLFHGALDELYLYARALTQEDIRSLLSDDSDSVNRPPVVEAGPNHTLRLPDTTVLVNGTVTDDDPAHAAQLEHSWSLVSGPGAVSFSPSADSLNVRVTFAQGGTYVLRLLARDALLQEGSDTLTVTVLTADAPDPSTGLVINEFMAGNSYIPYTDPLNIGTQVNGSDVHPDWIEIHNPTDMAVSLAGWSLTDDEQDLTKWPCPDRVLDAGDYVIVFASGKQPSDTPGNVPFQDDLGYVHTNFGLSMEGEYLGLVSPDGTVIHAYAPYPPQRGLVSFGLGRDGTAGFLKSATPGLSSGRRGSGNVNSDLYDGVVADITFSQTRGFYTRPVTVHLTCPTPDAEIRYTLDGSRPTAVHGVLYRSDQNVYIATTTCVRAAGFKANHLSSRVGTHTYLFVGHVKNQVRPTGYPRAWTSESGFIGESGDYAMDPEITEDPVYRDILNDALMSIPTLSIVTDKEHIFNASQGIYMKPKNHGVLWERPVSLEIVDPAGILDYHVDCGLRIQGGHTRLPSKNPKHSFRVLFKAGYGAGKMRLPLFGPDAADEFDNIVLRGGGNQSWLHHNTFKGDNRGRAQFIRDQWAKDVQKAMGGLASGNIYAHLYLNGLYWGLYNPTERPDAAFAATYLGGEKAHYDALNSGEVLEGDSDAYNALFSAANADLTNRDAYEAFAKRLDIPAFIDYMIIHQFGGNLDWDDHNWYAFARREPMSGPFTFASWDTEFIFINDTEAGVQANRINLNNNNNPSRLFQRLRDNHEFRLMFADHVHRHLRHNGLLTPAQVVRLWDERKSQCYRALVGESARWGDYRRDVHPRGGPTPIPLYDRNEEWQAQYNELKREYFPLRTQYVLRDYRNAGLYPSLDPPVFRINDQESPGEIVTRGDRLHLVPTQANGTIYYTLDGSDPRQYWTGTAIGTRYQHALPLDRSVTVKARCRQGGTWSALHQATFVLDDLADALVISEIMYHPPTAQGLSDPHTEYLELKNRSSHSINLTQVAFTRGIHYRFERVGLEPGQCLVLAKDPEALRRAYAQLTNAVTVLGPYAGKLDNGGERLQVRDAHQRLLIDLSYRDEWYPSTDGQGNSLTYKPDSEPLSLKSAWQPGNTYGGTPGVTE